MVMDRRRLGLGRSVQPVFMTDNIVNKRITVKISDEQCLIDHGEYVSSHTLVKKQTDSIECEKKKEVRGKNRDHDLNVWSIRINRMNGFSVIRILGPVSFRALTFRSLSEAPSLILVKPPLGFLKIHLWFGKAIFSLLVEIPTTFRNTSMRFIAETNSSNFNLTNSTSSGSKSFEFTRAKYSPIQNSTSFSQASPPWCSILKYSYRPICCPAKVE